MADSDVMEQQVFDMGFSTNARINYLFWNCNIAMQDNNPEEWFKHCKNLYKEIVPRVDEQKEIDHHKSTITKIEKALNDLFTYNQNYSVAGKGHDYSPPRAVFDILFEWEITLRTKCNKLGLLYKEKYGHAL